MEVTTVNGLGSVTARLTVSAQQHLAVIKSRIKPVVLGIPSQIVIILTGSPELYVSINYGDDDVISEMSTAADSELILTKSANSASEGAPEYRLTLNHTYAQLGDYLVIMGISNNVSRVMLLLTASVGELLSDVTMVTDAVSPLATNSVISATASVTSGRDIVFNWTCVVCTSQPVVHR